MSALKSYEKRFVYLEQRQYVHGTSMSSGLFETVALWDLGAIEKIQMNIHSSLTEHGRYDLYPINDKPHLSEKGYNALFRLACDTGTYVVGLKGNGERVSDRRPYDEDSLVNGYHVVQANKSAVFKLNTKLPLLNVLIALNKKLVNRLFPAEGYGQWFLSRYDLDWAEACRNIPETLEIKIAGNIGLGHTFSTIIMGETTMGSIYFSRSPI